MQRGRKASAMKSRERISVDPNVCHGKACIKDADYGLGDPG